MNSTDSNNNCGSHDRHQVPKAAETYAFVAPVPGDGGATTMNDQMITPYSVAIPRHDLDDLQRRLIGTRWPDVVPLRNEWPGVPLEAMGRAYV
jgi:hypothetical protein